MLYFRKKERENTEKEDVCGGFEVRSESSASMQANASKTET